RVDRGLQHVFFRRSETEFNRLCEVGECQVGMRFDEAGHQRGALPVDDHRVAGPDRGAGGNHCANPVALDEHGTVERTRPGAVQDPDIPEQGRAHGPRLFAPYRFSMYMRFQVGLMMSWLMQACAGISAMKRMVLPRSS